MGRRARIQVRGGAGRGGGSPPHTGAWPQGRSPPPTYHTLPTAVAPRPRRAGVQHVERLPLQRPSTAASSFPGCATRLPRAAAATAYEDFNLQLRPRPCWAPGPPSPTCVLRSQGLVLEVSTLGPHQRVAVSAAGGGSGSREAGGGRAGGEGRTRGSTDSCPGRSCPTTCEAPQWKRSSAYVKINIRLMLTFMWSTEKTAPW